MFELERDDDLDDLALDAFFRREKEAARQLHRQCRSALLLLPRGHVAEYCFHQPPVVHAIVLKEAPVLDSQHRIHQVLGNFIVGDQPPLGAIRIFAQAVINSGSSS